eukprot:scaffold3920_cov134-Isochrysis_galbana.AAC.1
MERPAHRRSIVIASDIATLTELNQDGATHHRHAYMRRCLQPAAPEIQRWYRQSGVAFTCNTSVGILAGGAATAPPGLGDGRCDPGALGLIDLLLTSQAATLTAADVRRPWPSAFLEWIVRIRRRHGKPTNLISCSAVDVDVGAGAPSSSAPAAASSSSSSQVQTHLESR